MLAAICKGVVTVKFTWYLIDYCSKSFGSIAQLGDLFLLALTKWLVLYLERQIVSLEVVGGKGHRYASRLYLPRGWQQLVVRWLL